MTGLDIDAEEQSMSGAVVLFSGGMDSTCCLFFARGQYRRVHALAVDYGQRHAEQELLAARRIAAKLEVPLTLMQMRIDWQATLCALSRPLRSGLDEDGVSHAFVPGRNLHLLTIAAAHARKVDAAAVVIGCCADDANAFPDCRREFLESTSRVLSLALGREIVVTAPLVGTFKRDVVADAMPALRALLKESWSCYTPRGQEPCGECDACRLRTRAFEAA